MRTILLAMFGLALLSGCVSPKQMERATARTDLGVAYIREGNVESAVATLREAAELDGSSWRTWNALAVAYVAKGDEKLARKAFHRAIRAAPDEGEVLVSRGSFLVRTGHLKEAIADYRAALRDLDYRNHAVALSNLSYALVLSGDAKEGAAVAREALRRAPSLCEARFHLGLALEKLGDAPGAIAAYGAHVEQCPERSLGARVQLGCLLMAQGSRPRGLEQLDAVVAAAPESAFATSARACKERP
jgi:Tfp pilus assembly protein PilF